VWCNILNKLLKINFEYRVEISYALFFLALSTLLIKSELIYESLAAYLNIEAPAAMSLLFSIIAVLNLLAGALRISACAYLGSEVMMKKEVQAKKMTVAGPYAYVRNPIYLSDIISMTATAFAGNIYSVAVLFLGKVITSSLFCIYEEENLLKYLGNEYKDYYDRVPRFIPKLYQYHNTDILAHKNYSDGMKNSFYPIGIAAGFLAGAITQTYLYIFIIGAIAPVGWFILYRKRRI